MNRPGAIERVARLFAAEFGRFPEGIWAAPGRVNLIGEHTDYNDGFALPLALDRYASAAVALRFDGKARCVSAEFGAGPEVQLSRIGPNRAPVGWTAYPLGVAWALAQTGIEVPGFDLLVTSDVPPGAGVSSSAALECCVALALSDLAGAVVDRTDLALIAQRAENDIAGAPTGIMDQLVSLRARAGHALFLDCRSLVWRHIPFDPSGADLALLVIDTQTRHDLASGGYADRRGACQDAAHILGVASLRDATEESVRSARDRLGGVYFKRAWHVVTENARVLSAVAALEAAPSGNLRAIGTLLSASHASLRDSYDVSCPELDAACESAEAAGALGARLIGGGFGGSAIALVPSGQVGAVTTSVTVAAATKGFSKPRVFAAQRAHGAERVA
jgi:galactokinase